MKKIIIIFIGLFLFSLEIHSQKKVLADSLIIELNKTETDTIKMRLYLEIGNEFSRTKLARQYFEKGLEIAKKIDNKKYIINFYNEVGSYYFYATDYDKASDFFYKSLKLSEAINNDTAKARVYNFLVMLNGEMKYYDKAMKYAKKSLKIGYKIKDNDRIAAILNNMGLIYQLSGKEDSAVVCYEKCIDISKKIKNMTAYAMAVNNLATYFQDKGNNEKALIYFENALEVAKQNNQKEQISMYLMNIAGTYLHFYFNATTVKDKNKNKRKAIENVEIAIETSKKFDNLIDIKASYALASEIYKISGNYLVALAYLDSSYQVVTKIYDVEKTKIAEEVEAKFETKKKQIEIEKQQFVLNNQKFEMRILYTSIVVILVFFTVMIYLIISRSKIKNKVAELVLREKIKKHKTEQTNLALQIVQKDALLNEILANLKLLGRKLKIKNAEADIQNLFMEIKLKLNVDKERIELKEKIESHSKGFFDNLSSKYTELTVKEKNVAALVRLNFSSKDIAILMNVAPKTIVTYRYRIRKKMNLDNDTNLASFLNQL